MIQRYFETQKKILSDTVITDKTGKVFSLTDGFEAWFRAVESVRAQGKKIIFIGNGGSAGIASHQSIDFSNRGGVRALAFTDPSMLTCLSNDYGYENVYHKALEFHADPGDLLIAISSSGKSENILRGVSQMRTKGCRVVTLSGFHADNPLRKSGDCNLYTPSSNYTLVENAHHTLMHAFLACYVHPRFDAKGGDPQMYFPPRDVEITP